MAMYKNGNGKISQGTNGHRKIDLAQMAMHGTFDQGISDHEKNNI